MMGNPTLIGQINAEMARITPMLKIFEPTTLPMAISP